MKKYAIGLATAALFGAGAFQQADAGVVVLPYMKSGGNWVSLATITDLSAATSPIYVAHLYKPDWSVLGDGTVYLSRECTHYDSDIPTTANDMTTVDFAAGNLLGLTGNTLGAAEGYDTAPAGPWMHPNVGYTTDFYTVLVNTPDILGALLLFGGDDGTLAAEAVVFDLATGMFFYQAGVDAEGSADVDNDGAITGTNVNDPTAGGINRLAPTNSIVTFQGTDFADTSVYYLPMQSYNTGSPIGDLIGSTLTGTRSITGALANDLGGGIGGGAYDRREVFISGGRNVEVNCLGLVRVRHLVVDGVWATLGASGGFFRITDTGGMTYKGEVFSIGTRPNIFAPLKSYEISTAQD